MFKKIKIKSNFIGRAVLRLQKLLIRVRIIKFDYK